MLPGRACPRGRSPPNRPPAPARRTRWPRRWVAVGGVELAGHRPAVPGQIIGAAERKRGLHSLRGLFSGKSAMSPFPPPIVGGPGHPGPCVGVRGCVGVAERRAPQRMPRCCRRIKGQRGRRKPVVLRRDPSHSHRLLAAGGESRDSDDREPRTAQPDKRPAVLPRAAKAVRMEATIARAVDIKGDEQAREQHDKAPPANLRRRRTVRRWVAAAGPKAPSAFSARVPYAHLGRWRPPRRMHRGQTHDATATPRGAVTQCCLPTAW